MSGSPVRGACDGGVPLVVANSCTWARADEATGTSGSHLASHVSPSPSLCCSQVILAKELKKPLFMHCRDAGAKFAEILRWVHG